MLAAAIRSGIDASVDAPKAALTNQITSLLTKPLNRTYGSWFLNPPSAPNRNGSASGRQFRIGADTFLCSARSHRFSSLNVLYRGDLPIRAILYAKE